MSRIFLFPAFLILVFLVQACSSLLQENSGTANQYQSRQTLQTKDWVYQTNIKTPTLYRAPIEESYPVLTLNTTEQLVLEFDELLPIESRESDFYVDIINCNANWEKSNLVPIEYFEGFLNERITDFQRSTFTKIPYVHYRYAFPEENEFFKKSGNYLLKVYRNGDPNDLILTRRFVVVEKRLRMNLTFMLNARMERELMTDFSFELFPGDLPITNPAFDLQVKILQNFRWDNAIQQSEPRFQATDRFEYQVNLQDKFSGGNEFRRLELMSTQLYGGNVREIEERENLFDVYLVPDKIYKNNTFGARRDRNGSFAIRTYDLPEAQTQADYLRTHFSIRTYDPFEGEVYVFGELTDWELKPDYRLDYNDVTKRYEGSTLIKQGLYDYQYVVKESGSAIPNESYIEGRHNRSENFYSVIVYYRSPTDRTDQIVGFLPINYYE